MALRPGQKLTDLSRSELCEFASALCGKIEEEVGRFSYRGGIYSGNISIDEEGKIAIGPEGGESAGETELLYVSPELYWDGRRTPAGVVYSVGLLMYFMSENRLPLESGDCSPKDAQQLRLQGSAFSYPASAGKRLGDIIMKALSFKEADRYSNVAEMKISLDSCLKNLFLSDAPRAEAVFNKNDDNLSDIERMMLSIIENRDEFEEEIEGPDTEETDSSAPEEPESSSAEEAGTLEADMTSLTVEACPETESAENFITELAEEELPEELFPEAENPPEEITSSDIYIPAEKPEERQTETRRIPEIKPELEPIRITRKTQVEDDFPDIAVTTDGRSISRLQRESAAEMRRRRRRPMIFILVTCTLLIAAAVIFNLANKVPDAYVEPVEAEQPEAAVPSEWIAVPEETPAEEIAEEPVQMVSSFEFVKANISWSAAKERCDEMGGYLAVITGPEELIRVTALAEQNGVGYVWIGLHRVNGELVWEKEAAEGEEYYYRWAEGEPSEYDGDTPEDYVLLSYMNGNWYYNDCIADPSPLYGWYWDNLGFVCETETPAE